MQDAHSRWTRNVEARIGRIMSVKSCLPVHISIGLMIAGDGNSIGSLASLMYLRAHTPYTISVPNKFVWRHMRRMASSGLQQVARFQHDGGTRRGVKAGRA